MNGKQVNIKNNYKYGGSVEFECNDNYTFAGSSLITCGESKDWSAPLPRCFGEFFFSFLFFSSSFFCRFAG